MQLNTEKWTLSGEISTMGFSNNICSSGGFITDKSRYAIDCTDGTVFVLTVKNISREFNGIIFTCGGFIPPESNSVTIFVIVPVKSSKISPYSKVHTSSENSTMSLQCTTSECRPEPKFLWYINNSQMSEGDKVVTFQTPVASPSTIQPYINSIRINLTRELNGWYIFCAAVNYNGIPVFSDRILLNVTYPPDGPPSISTTSNSSELTVFRKDFVHAVCSIRGGNPLPVLRWDKNDESTLHIIGNTVTKSLIWEATGSDPVDLICQSLHPDRNETVYVTVHTLFAPEKIEVTLYVDAQFTLNIKHTFNVIENTSNTMVFTCAAISNPTPTSYWWTGPIESNSARLELNMTRHLQGIYTCNVNNTMIAQDGRVKIGFNSLSYAVDILHKAEILSFSINNDVNSLTVNETARVHFVCKVDSNPSSTVEITFNDKIMSTKSNTLTLEYLRSVNCNDTGTYVCTGSNAYNKGKKARLDNTLFVLCSPRRPPSFELKQNVTSALNDTATFQFTAMAYPPPRFQWYRVINGNKNAEAQEGVIANYSISPNEMQINFTMGKVENIHYGEYLLKVENPYGTFSQTFYLVAEGKPNQPTFYGFYPESVSSNSVTIWWERGFDGGLPQYFIISYNRTVSKWYNETVIIHNTENRINKTITELASGCVYHILIYAQNEMGAVHVPHAIIVNTKEVSSETLATRKSVGPAIGGTVGGLFAVITATVSLLIVRKHSVGKQTRAQNKAGDLHTYQNFQNDGQSPSEVSFSAIYERLQHADSKSDQQYQQLATFSEKDKTDGRNERVYENLKLSQHNKQNNVE